MRIDVFADVVCPWCYIGKRQLDQALERLPHLRVERRWRPFILRPDLPEEGVPWRTFAERKFGSWARAETAFSHVAAAGARAGVQFDFERVASAPNTRAAHRLIVLAEQEQRGWMMAERLFRAYFMEACDLGDADTLVQLAGSIGLDADAVRGYLASDEGNDVVEEARREAVEIGIGGVPFYVIDGRYGLSGAQPVPVLVDALETAAEHEVAA